MLAARSGAKDLLASAVAELLVLRPLAPVAFLANQLRSCIGNAVPASPPPLICSNMLQL